MCPYQDQCWEQCPAQLYKASFESCARFKLASVIGIDKVPVTMKAMDYAFIAPYIRSFSGNE
ncbi:MAG: hypothetical protein E6713_12010 [Sporomusaceae bacterium]|nr:hypothetical protein [Sporomusaceae bacterium]